MNQTWYDKRIELEKGLSSYATRKKRVSDLLELKGVHSFLYHFLKYTGLLSVGQKNAYSISVVEKEIFIPNLPPSLQSLRIMHLSDLHFDTMTEINSKIEKILQGQAACDLVVLTGDYLDKKGNEAITIKKFNELVEILKHYSKSEKCYAVLGNHDPAHFVTALQDNKALKFLINESVVLEHGETNFLLTGLDDIHHFKTEQSAKALESSNLWPLKILLVHSPEYYREVEACAYHLYLCGHTHGGQVCLPGGIPILTHSDTKRSFVKNLWQYHQLRGHTSVGTGACYLPVRFFTRGEVSILTLQSGG